MSISACQARKLVTATFAFFGTLRGIGAVCAQEVEANASPVLEEIVVTAQKRAQSINDVGMSINAATGAQLQELGISDVSQLTKLVTGFNFTETAYGTPVYTIRGVGFQENSLAASPAVSVYVDEIPLPFPAETIAVGLDPERVEVLKGPQGTLYGENSTGGAVNYIAAKPTDHFTTGFTASYGRFNTGNVEAFVSGPITDTLKGRLAVRTIQSSDWQYSYTSSDTLGAKNLVEARGLLDWQPVEDLEVALTLNVWQDRSDSPAAQVIGIYPQTNLISIPAGLTNYPLAPGNDRAADWDRGVSFQRHNRFYQAALRLDYKLPDDLTVTSISAHERYTRNQPVDTDGTAYQNFYVGETGWINTTFQELRLSGLLGGRGNWIVGGNYETDDTFDSNLIEFADSSSREAVGLPFSSAINSNHQDIHTTAFYGNVEYPLIEQLTFQAGARYTKADRSFAGCTYDSGDGQLSAVFTSLSSILQGAPQAPIAPGGCGTLNATTFKPGPVLETLDENNVSWRTGLNWKPTAAMLIYGNVSRGYKAGSFPTLSASSSVQFSPVRQESVVAYEVGFKDSLLDNTLQLNPAVFYYDYDNKQIRGKLADPIFGDLEALVNIPKSHIEGFELSANWRPFQGFDVTPAVTLVRSQIDGNFSNYTPLGTFQNISGEAFPYTPKWSASLDAQYSFPLAGGYRGFVGEITSAASATEGGFGDLPEFKIGSYVLLDLRAGVRSPDDNWTVSLYGHNVTDKYYWTSASHLVDTITRYAGMPATYGVQATYRFQ
jgi:iron complex outermembrane recepter protein